MLVGVVVQSFGRREIYLYSPTFQPNPAISLLPRYQLRLSSAWNRPVLLTLNKTKTKKRLTLFVIALHLG
jgi:hypothetical protein